MPCMDADDEKFRSVRDSHSAERKVGAQRTEVGPLGRANSVDRIPGAKQDRSSLGDRFMDQDSFPSDPCRRKSLLHEGDVWSEA